MLRAGASVKGNADEVPRWIDGGSTGDRQLIAGGSPGKGVNIVAETSWISHMRQA